MPLWLELFVREQWGHHSCPLVPPHLGPSVGMAHQSCTGEKQLERRSQEDASIIHKLAGAIQPGLLVWSHRSHPIEETPKAAGQPEASPRHWAPGNTQEAEAKCSQGMQDLVHVHSEAGGGCGRTDEGCLGGSMCESLPGNREHLSWVLQYS
jgi:hypothetical protein